MNYFAKFEKFLPHSIIMLSCMTVRSQMPELLMSSMAWVKRCFSEKSKNLNKLLVFEALYP